MLLSFTLSLHLKSTSSEKETFLSAISKRDFDLADPQWRTVSAEIPEGMHQIRIRINDYVKDKQYIYAAIDEITVQDGSCLSKQRGRQKVSSAT